MNDITRRVEQLNWASLEDELNQWGYARTGKFLSQKERSFLIGLYDDSHHFRSVIQMERFRFGNGEYKYFADPLPPLIEELRQAMYPFLAGIANRWAQKLRDRISFPASWTDFYQRCKHAGQERPTPLILRYTAGGYNCLHQDVYGDIAFPLQITSVLNQVGTDFTGGQFLLVEQRPRAQSRGEAIAADAGELVIFPNRYRPVAGKNGYYRVNTKHGVSRVLSGKRYAFGIIFHTAK